MRYQGMNYFIYNTMFYWATAFGNAAVFAAVQKGLYDFTGNSAIGAIGFYGSAVMFILLGLYLYFGNDPDLPKAILGATGITAIVQMFVFFWWGKFASPEQHAVTSLWLWGATIVFVTTLLSMFLYHTLFKEIYAWLDKYEHGSS